MKTNDTLYTHGRRIHLWWGQSTHVSILYLTNKDKFLSVKSFAGSACYRMVIGFPSYFCAAHCKPHWFIITWMKSGIDPNFSTMNPQSLFSMQHNVALDVFLIFITFRDQVCRQERRYPWRQPQESTMAWTSQHRKDLSIGLPMCEQYCLNIVQKDPKKQSKDEESKHCMQSPLIKCDNVC